MIRSRRENKPNVPAKGEKTRSVARVFSTFLCASMGILTLCIFFVITIAMQHDLSHMRATESSRQIEYYGRSINLYVANRLVVLKDQAEVPFATQAVMDPETHRANISDFLELFTLLGDKPDMVLLDYAGFPIQASPAAAAFDFRSIGGISALLNGSKAEYAEVLNDGDELVWCFAVPITYHEAVEGCLVAIMPLEKMVEQLNLRQQHGASLQLYQEDRLLVAYGNLHPKVAGTEKVLDAFDLRLVYRNEFSDFSNTRLQFILEIMATILLFALALVGMASVWGRRLLVAPLEDIRQATSQLADGEDVDLAVLTLSPLREIQQLGHAFKVMAIELRAREAELREDRDNLENKVQAQTQSLLESEQRYSRVIDGTRAGIWEWNIQTGETIFNERWAEICGYRLEELEPVNIETWKRLAHPEDLQISNSALERHFSGELPYYEAECRMKHKNGYWVWVHDRGKVVSWNEENKPLLMAGTHIDVTTRKQFENDFAHLSKIQSVLMRLATEFVNIPVFQQRGAIKAALSSIGGLIRAERAYLFEYNFAEGTMSNTYEWCCSGIAPQKDNLQKLPLDLFPDWVNTHCKGQMLHIPFVDELPEDTVLSQTLKPQGIKSLVTLPMMHKETCLGFVGFDSVTELRSWTNEEVGLLKVMAELFSNLEGKRMVEEMMHNLNEEQSVMIQQMELLQADLLCARDDAQSAARAKSMFLANMSHEIRTPLNAILGYAQIINRTCLKELPESAQKGLGVIVSSGAHLLELVNDILLLARCENTPQALSLSDFDFHQLLLDVQSMFAQAAEARGNQISVENRLMASRWIHSDRSKVRQVLINLVGNAAKFTQSGHIRIIVDGTMGTEEGLGVVAPSCSLGESLVSVCIEDTGKGIPADQLERIFAPFEQADTGIGDGHGTGLGLSISRMFARELGGDLTAESKESLGSRFLFTFKAHPVKPWGDLHLNKVATLAPGQPEFRMLVVEDDETSLEMVSTLLSSIGFSIKAARTGAQALDLLARDSSFDAVLMDQKMPEMDGIEALKHMRGIPALQKLPVLFLTANAAPGEEERVLALGANGLVPKPIDECMLLDEIQRVVRVKYMYEAVEEAVPTTSQDAFLFEGVASLSDSEVEALRHELGRGHIHGLLTIIDRIMIENPKLARELKKITQNYEYQRLERLLENKGNTTTVPTFEREIAIKPLK